jgi:nitrite reductase (NO-forming)
MSPHHLSARIWATAALISLALPADVRLGWWLPLHLALAGATTQLIAGGQLMFSATLALSPGPSRRAVLVHLAALNAGAAGVTLGRVMDAPLLLGAGATVFTAAVLWLGVTVGRLWRGSPNRRFRATGHFYSAAVASVVLGASLGWALGAGAIGADSYVSHRMAHMLFNLVGWAGLTILGTAITLLPTILHVRAAKETSVVRTPWILFAALLTLTLGLAAGWLLVATMGAVLLVAGLKPFAEMVLTVMRTPRRRAIPVAALHLIAALAWFGFVIVLQVPLVATEKFAFLQYLWRWGLGLGFVLQAVLGAWAFLLPMARPGIPELRRRELIAFEIGAAIQVVAYNVGVLLLVLGHAGPKLPWLSTIGAALFFLAVVLGVIKGWTYPLLARGRRVAERSAQWWAPVS